MNSKQTGKLVEFNLQKLDYNLTEINENQNWCTVIDKLRTINWNETNLTSLEDLLDD
jgi:hypothetical protein